MKWFRNQVLIQDPDPEEPFISAWHQREHVSKNSLFASSVLCVCVCVCVCAQSEPASLPAEDISTNSNGPKQDLLFDDDPEDLFAGTHTHTHTLFFYIYIYIYIINQTLERKTNVEKWSGSEPKLWPDPRPSTEVGVIHFSAFVLILLTRTNMVENTTSSVEVKIPPDKSERLTSQARQHISLIKSTAWCCFSCSSLFLNAAHFLSWESDVWNMLLVTRQGGVESLVAFWEM